MKSRTLPPPPPIQDKSDETSFEWGSLADRSPLARSYWKSMVERGILDENSYPAAVKNPIRAKNAMKTSPDRSLSAVISISG